LSEKELERLKAGQAYVATFGMIVYFDQFGTHWYRFCNWNAYSTSGVVTAGSCVGWNIAGDGKPTVR
jgi:hypothetical protein